MRISESERFVICHNPEAAERDAKVRSRMLAQLDELITGSDTLTKTKRAELRGVISTKPGLNRYLRVTPGGLLRTDAAAIKAEENLDGKYLLRCSDPRLPAEDIALGYKQLLEVEHGWRDLKQVIDLQARLPPQRGAHQSPRHLVLARPAAHPHRRDHDRHHLGQHRRRARTCSPSARSPARPARSGRPPSSPRPSATCSPSSRSRTRRRSSRPPRPQLPDQQEHRRLVTRPITTTACVPAGQT